VTPFAANVAAYRSILDAFIHSSIGFIVRGTREVPGFPMVWLGFAWRVHDIDRHRRQSGWNPDRNWV
jgi:hypothetical protein